MTDFWFTFGAMVIDPTLLDGIAAEKPGFDRIKMTITEGTNPPVELPAAGHLRDADTTHVREYIRDYAKKYESRPIISLYTAGKLCQLVNTDAQRITTSIKRANSIFEKAALSSGLTPPYSARLATMLGVALIDARMSNALIQGIQDDVAEEFGIDANAGGAEWETIKSFAKNSDLNSAYSTLILSASWVHVCGQVFFFYDKFKNAAN